MWGAHNLHLWLKREKAAAKAAAAMLLRPRKLHRRRSQEAVVQSPASANIPKAAVTEGSRAP